MSSQPNESTSEPIYAAAKSVGAGVTAVISVLGGAVALGVLSSDQAAQFTAAGNELVTNLPILAGAVVTIVGIVSGFASAIATAWNARKKVIPIDSDQFTVVPGEVVSSQDIGPFNQG